MKHKTVTVAIESLSHEGRGIASWNQKKLFVRGALPTEIVSATITHNYAKYAEGIATEIIQPAAAREMPICKHFGTCGGCSLQHVSPLDQITHKQQMLGEHLWHIARTDATHWLPPLTGPTQHYRYKARLGVKYLTHQHKVVIGFREIQGRDITDCNQCEILPEIIGKQLPLFAELISQLSIAAAIPQLEIAIGDTQAAIIFRHLQPFSTEDRMLLCQFRQQHSLAVYAQSGNPSNICKYWPLDGEEYLSYYNPDFNIHYQFHPTDFTQINPAVNLAMVKEAIRLLQLNADDTVLDLFCGIGNFSLPAATIAKAVVGVEGDLRMVQRAKHNSSLNQLNNTEFFTSDLTQFDHQQLWVRSYTKLILDPPRCGAGIIVKELRHLGKLDIVYISCNPATFARDASILIQQGYRLAEVGVIDMFPHTGHIESIARFYYE